MGKKTKIVCTMGPSTDKPGIVEKMIDAGMNVARFNFSHGTHEEHAARIAMVRAAADKTGAIIGLMLDNKGPEVRLGLFDGGKVPLKAGEQFILTAEDVLGTAKRASTTHNKLQDDVSVGDIILLSDGLISLKVLAIAGSEITTEILNDGVIGDRKRVAVPGAHLKLPPLSERDVSDVLFGVEQGMDFIAASFTQSADDVRAIRAVLKEVNSDMAIIAKIESASGVRNIKEIIKEANGIMVARGDLGVEVPTEDVPIIQKMIIAESNIARRPVITATQMLESMITNPRPTRAEASDIANAIMDGTDAIMLSGETAAGSYPAEAVEMMSRIALRTEEALKYHEMLAQKGISDHELNVTMAISHATVSIAQEVGAQIIISPSESGFTPLMISKYRPKACIVAVSPNDRPLRKMTLIWGVYPLKGSAWKYTDQMVSNVISIALSQGLCENGDTVVVTAGVPIGKSGSTNMIRVQKVGQSVFKGIGIGHRMAVGTTCVCHSDEELRTKLEDKRILVIKSLTAENASYAARASAIICEDPALSSAAVIVGISHGIPVIAGLEGATDLIMDKITVTVDPIKGEVYQGSH